MQIKDQNSQIIPSEEIDNADISYATHAPKKHIKKKIFFLFFLLLLLVTGGVGGYLYLGIHQPQKITQPKPVVASDSPYVVKTISKSEKQLILNDFGITFTLPNTFDIKDPYDDINKDFSLYPPREFLQTIDLAVSESSSLSLTVSESKNFANDHVSMFTTTDTANNTVSEDNSLFPAPTLYPYAMQTSAYVVKNRDDNDVAYLIKVVVPQQFSDGKTRTIRMDFACTASRNTCIRLFQTVLLGFKLSSPVVVIKAPQEKQLQFSTQKDGLQGAIFPKYNISMSIPTNFQRGGAKAKIIEFAPDSSHFAVFYTPESTFDGPRAFQTQGIRLTLQITPGTKILSTNDIGGKVVNDIPSEITSQVVTSQNMQLTDLQDDWSRNGYDAQVWIAIKGMDKSSGDFSPFTIRINCLEFIKTGQPNQCEKIVKKILPTISISKEFLTINPKQSLFNAKDYKKRNYSESETVHAGNNHKLARLTSKQLALLSEKKDDELVGLQCTPEIFYNDNQPISYKFVSSQTGSQGELLFNDIVDQTVASEVQKLAKADPIHRVPDHMTLCKTPDNMTFASYLSQEVRDNGQEEWGGKTSLKSAVFDSSDALLPMVEIPDVPTLPSNIRLLQVTTDQNVYVQMTTVYDNQIYLIDLKHNTSSLLSKCSMSPNSTGDWECEQ